jgi:tRNA(Ile2) C34 agmatinyltransferase TiaS
MEGLSQVLGQTNTSCPYCGETINIAKLWKGQYDG